LSKKLLSKSRIKKKSRDPKTSGLLSQESAQTEAKESKFVLT